MAFTPELEFGGGTTGITYSTRLGQAFAIGDFVFYVVHIVLTSKGTDTGTATITGLPFSCNGGSYGSSMLAHNINGTLNYTYFGAIVELSSAVINLVECGPGQTRIVLDDTSFNNDSELHIISHYEKPFPP